jgi:hypothetical protein
MPTITKNTTDTFVKWAEIPAASNLFIQNRGSAVLELFIGTTAPAAGDVGILLQANDIGIQIQLGTGEEVYIKDTDVSRPTIVVAVV